MSGLADRTGLTPLAVGGSPASAREVVASLRLHDDVPSGRPRVVGVMIASLDGRAAVAGSSVGLGNPADRALLRTLRAEADVALIGSRTLLGEGYARLVDAELAQARTAAGRPPTPTIATVTRRGDVPWGIGLFAEPSSRVLVYSGADVRAPADVSAQVEVVAGDTDLTAVLADMRARHGATLVSCEGGPTLLHALLVADLVDDLVMTLAPLLLAGDALGVLAGAQLDPPVRLALASAHRAEDHLMLHYRRR